MLEHSTEHRRIGHHQDYEILLDLLQLFTLLPHGFRDIIRYIKIINFEAALPRTYSLAVNLSRYTCTGLDNDTPLLPLLPLLLLSPPLRTYVPARS